MAKAHPTSPKPDINSDSRPVSLLLTTPVDDSRHGQMIFTLIEYHCQLKTHSVQLCVQQDGRLSVRYWRADPSASADSCSKNSNTIMFLQVDAVVFACYSLTGLANCRYIQFNFNIILIISVLHSCICCGR